jgi:zinc/manganese transport system substrate-binding protein
MILKMAVAGLVAFAVAGCSSDANESETKEVVVTYSVLGAVVSQLVGDAANVRVIIPDGTDPHNFRPSAKDVEAMNDAALVVANGLHLEEGLEDVLDTLPSSQVFFASDHVTVRSLNDEGEHADEHSDESHTDGEHGHGPEDPHFWLSPFAMTEMVDELASALETALSVDLGERSTALIADLTALDTAIDTRIGDLESCELISGHEEMGYFADRYGCELIGAVIPSLSTSAEASANQLAELKDLVAEHDVRAIFSGVGTPSNLAEQIANETGVPLVEISTHVMGDDDTYASFMTRFVDTIVTALQ